VQKHRHVAPPTPDDFATSMRIGVRPLDHTRSLPILRVDRHGLTVAVDDGIDIDLPPIGLPRSGLIVGDSDSLCALRLVSRAVVRREGHAVEMMMQPSRADDHAVLWQALRVHQQRFGVVTAGDRAPWPAGREGPGRAEPHRARQIGATNEEGAVAVLPERQAGPAAMGIDDSPSLVSCDTTFTMVSHDDAWFFSHWLEYHFAEVRARTRMSSAAADLRDIHTRIADHELEVRFLFQASERIVRACTEASCRWIAAEAARQIGTTSEHWLSSRLVAGGSLAQWPRPAVLTSGATRYPS